MKKWLSVIGLTVVMAVGAFAQAFDFTLVNDTGYTIYSVYVSPSIDDEYGDDILAEDVLEDGDEVEITFDSDYEAMLLDYGVEEYDLRCEYEDGSYDEWFELELEEIVELVITLDKDGNGVATWE